MKYPLSILLIGISYLTACSSSPDSHFPRYSDFPKTKALSAQVINLDTILFRYPLPGSGQGQYRCGNGFT